MFHNGYTGNYNFQEAIDVAKKKIGLGTLSLLLSFAGIAWAFTLKGVCLGDNILSAFGISAWSNGNSGTHYTVFYSLVFFILSVVLGLKYSRNLGAKAGRAISIIIGAIIILSTFGLVL